MKFAILGTSCYLPGNNNTVIDFKKFLEEKADGIKKCSRWDTSYWRQKMGLPIEEGGFVDEFFTFDPSAFNMSTNEASQIDLQQKILLKSALHSLEHSRIIYRKKRVGCFVGSGHSDYQTVTTYEADQISTYSSVGFSLAVNANRISYVFDLRGPSLNVDTACSSSATALHYACNSLEKEECDYALVGGVNIILHPHSILGFHKLGVLSPDCRCKSFDENANGYVRSEGCVSVVITTLDRAIKENLPIRAVVCGTYINSDGARSNSLTIPSKGSQSKMINTVLLRNKVAKKDVAFVECHATGTTVGDTVEINTVGEVLGLPERPLRVGAVKTNLGHAECASFMVSFLKAIIMIENNLLIPNQRTPTLNSKIRFQELNLKVQTEVEEFNLNKIF